MHDNNSRARTLANSASLSRAAGLSFGRLWYKNNPGMTVEEAHKFAIGLHPKSPINRTVYIEFFIAGFTAERNAAVLQTYGKIVEVPGGNMLPLPQGENQMSIISEVNKSLSSVKYLKPGDIHTADVIFNIKSITKIPAKGKFGPQWKMEIEVRQDTGDSDFDLGIEEGMITYLSLGCGGRDKKIEKLITLLPLYNCFLTVTELDDNAIYYDIQDLDETDPMYISPPEKELPKSTTKRTPRIAKKPKVSEDYDPFLDSDNLP